MKRILSEYTNIFHLFQKLKYSDKRREYHYKRTAGKIIGNKLYSYNPDEEHILDAIKLKDGTVITRDESDVTHYNKPEPLQTSDIEKVEKLLDKGLDIDEALLLIDL